MKLVERNGKQLPKQPFRYAAERDAFRSAVAALGTTADASRWLDDFVSETIALTDVEEAFAKMHAGDVLRCVVVF